MYCFYNRVIRYLKTQTGGVWSVPWLELRPVSWRRVVVLGVAREVGQEVRISLLAVEYDEPTLLVQGCTIWEGSVQ